MAGLVLEQLRRVFPGKPEVVALDGLSLEARPGELLTLLGPSGSGKTTTLRLIAGLDRPAGGRILLEGQAIHDLPPERRPAGMAFQYPALLPQLTVAENLGLGLKLRKVAAAEAAPRVREMAEKVGVADLLARLPETLSGGQQQRVALGRALIIRPKILLLDEPLANLDPLARGELREIIRRLHREFKPITIYVTHDQSEAAAVADRIALLHQGRLQQAGTAAELYRDPANLFAARFFGPEGTNVLPGKMARQGGSVWFQPDGLAARWAVPNAKAEPREGCEATAVIRAQHFRLLDQPAEGAGSIACRVEDSVDGGWRTIIALRCGGNLGGVRLSAEVSEPGPEVGLEVHAVPTEVLYFVSQHGERWRGV